MNNEDVAYLLLQDKYIKQELKQEDYTEEDLMKKTQYLFPGDWFSLDVKDRIKIIAKAINEKKNLIYIYERETNEHMKPPRLGD